MCIGEQPVHLPSLSALSNWKKAGQELHRLPTKSNLLDEVLHRAILGRDL